MATLTCSFDDDLALDRALRRLGRIDAQLDTRVVESFAHKDEQPLPLETGASSWVPGATPTVATGHDVAPGRDVPHPQGMDAPTLEDLVSETRLDQELATRYRSIVAGGGALLVVRGPEDALKEARRVLLASGAGNLAVGSSRS